MFKPRYISQLLERGWATLPVPSLTAGCIEACYEDWVRFFRSEDKHCFRTTSGRLDGYFPRGTETAEGFAQPDQKEFFHFYRNRPCPAYCYKSSVFVFDRLVEKAAALLVELALEVPTLRKLCDGLAKSQRLVMRIARYIDHEGNGFYFSAPHNDANLLTLLPKATHPGLEVFKFNGWAAVSPSYEHCVVLCGDMLAEASQGRIPAALHRVISSKVDRLSLSFFLNPDDDIVLSPRWTAGEFLADRLRKIGIYAL